VCARVIFETTLKVFSKKYILNFLSLGTSVYVETGDWVAVVGIKFYMHVVKYVIQ